MSHVSVGTGGGSGVISGPTSDIWVNSGRTDSYTATGAIGSPYKTIKDAIAGMTPATYGAYVIRISPGTTYVEGTPSTFPAVPLVIRGNGATVVFVAGVTFQKAVAVYDLTIVGNVTQADTSLTAGHVFQNVVVSGNLTLSGLTILVGVAVAKNNTVAVLAGANCQCNGVSFGDVTDATGLVTIAATATAEFIASNCYSQIVNSGTLYYNSSFLGRNDNNGYALDSSVGGSVIYMSGVKVVNLGGGGGINCANGSLAPNSNEITGVDVTVAGLAKGITCGSAATALSNYNLNGLNGAQFYATGTNFTSSISAGLNINNISPTTALQITQTGNTSASISLGGTVNINNTLNTGAGLVIYSNAGAGQSGRQLVVYTQNAAMAVDTALIQSDSLVNTALNVKGSSTSTKAALKVEQVNNGNANVACISIDIGNGSSASAPLSQGLLIDSTNAVTTGKLVNVRNGGTEYFTIIPLSPTVVNVGIQTASPTARLHLPAGTATASTAPLKLTSGTNLTAAEAGAVEYDGTSLFYTVTSGPTRITLVGLENAQTFTNTKDFIANALRIGGASSGRALLNYSSTASDSTLLLPVATDTLAVLALAQTFTNKRVTARVVTTSGSATTVTPTGDTADVYEFVTSAGAGTLTAAAPTGTPTDGQALLLRINTSAAAQTWSWNGIYVASPSVALPTVTGNNVWNVIEFVYQVAQTKWVCVLKS